MSSWVFIGACRSLRNSAKLNIVIFIINLRVCKLHWDNIQPKKAPNLSGRSMLDGQTESKDKHKTENNRELVKEFVEKVLIDREVEYLDDFVDSAEFIQHSPDIADGSEALQLALSTKSLSGFKINYDQLHRVLAEGNFVLSVSEGSLDDTHCAFYDLFRVADDKLVEHWDTIEPIPPRSEWKNTNGKF